jgi:hypothetical protein
MVDNKILFRKYILDFLIIVINISNVITIIPYIIFSATSMGECLVYSFMMNLIYILFRFKLRIIFPENRTKRWAIFFFLLFLLFEVIKYPLITTNKGSFEFSLFVFLNNFIFFILLYNCFIEYLHILGYRKAINLVIYYYIIFCLYIIITTDFCWFLLNTEVISPYSNSVFWAIMNSNVSEAKAEYFFPGNLSILLITKSRIPLLQEYGVLCGLSHEPHVVNFMISPSLFFIFSLNNKNNIITSLLIFLYGLFFLITVSATNILTLLIVLLFIYILRSYNTKKSMILNNVLIFLIVFFIIILLENNDNIVAEISNFLDSKLNPTSTDSSSVEYSKERIFFTLKPSSVIGGTIFSTSLDSERGDIGLIPCILNILFLSSFIFSIIKLLGSKDKNLFYIGIGVLYFLIHSSKTNLLNYIYPFTVFIIFICTIACAFNKRLKKYTYEN